MAGCSGVRAGFQQRGDFVLHPGDGFWRGHVCLSERSLSAEPGGCAGYVPTAGLLALPGAVILRVS